MIIERNTDTIVIVERFFAAVDRLKADKVIRGTKTITNRYGMSRWNLLTIKRDMSLSGQFRPAWLMYLVRDYGVSAHWLLTGKGEFYQQGLDAEKVKKLQINCKTE